MRNVARSIVLLALLLALAPPLAALEAGTDIVVPAAARGAGAGGSAWVTSLYILNPGDTLTTVTIAWLVRDQANPNPETVIRNIPAGQLLVIDDALMDLFGLESGGGAFRITSPSPVVVNAGIFNRAGGKEFGQGVEGVPITAGLPAGPTTQAIGVASDSQYRTNFYAVNASDSALTLTVSLLDADGTVHGSKTYSLDAWEPILKNITDVTSTAVTGGMVSFNASGGPVLVGTSRVNNGTGDPLTLAAWQPASGGGGAGLAPSSLDGMVFNLTVNVIESGSTYQDQPATVTFTGPTTAHVQSWVGDFDASFETYLSGGDIGFVAGSIPEWSITNLHVVMVWTSSSSGSFAGAATDYDGTAIQYWGTFTTGSR